MTDTVRLFTRWLTPWNDARFRNRACFNSSISPLEDSFLQQALCFAPCLQHQMSDSQAPFGFERAQRTQSLPFAASWASECMYVHIHLSPMLSSVIASCDNPTAAPVHLRMRVHIYVCGHSLNLNGHLRFGKPDVRYSDVTGYSFVSAK